MATKNIGFVRDLEGAAQIRGVDGVIRVLSIGDAVYDGDLLTTAPGAKVLIEFFNGSQLSLGESTEPCWTKPSYPALIPTRRNRSTSCWNSKDWLPTTLRAKILN
jgi:hypothetical protein